MSPNCEIMVSWYQYLQCNGGVAQNEVEGKTLCNVFLTFEISVIQVLFQLQKGSSNFITIGYIIS